MAKKQKRQYPIGSISHGTMREEDLIPTFVSELEHMRPLKREHRTMLSGIKKRMEKDGYYESDKATYDLNESLFDALNDYAAPYFYFGAHPGDGVDFGFWLSESWDEEFESGDHSDKIKVGDISEIPRKFVGEVAVVNDHGNVTLYYRGRNHKLHEIWAVV